MIHTPEPTNTPEEASLFAFGDQPTSRPSNDLEATLRHVQRASGVDTAGSSTIPANLKHQIWEDLMHTQAAALEAGRLATGTPRTAAELVSARLAPMPIKRVSWNTAINALLAAALILALAAGVWRATGGVNLGFGDDGPNQPTIPFGGVIQDDGSVDPAELPTAEDCTVEPLTVDEVIWYIENPYEAFYGADIASPGPMPTEIVSATPPATNPPSYESGNASQEDLEAAAETQRMLTACVTADSYFQVWALLDPWTVRDMVLGYFPPLTGDDEARGYLENLEQNGPAGTDDRESGRILTGEFYSMAYAVQYAAQPGVVWVLDTDPANSWQNGPAQLIVGFAAYNEDGTLLYEATSIFDNRSGTPIAEDSSGLIDHFGCSFEFTWSEPRDMWLVRSGPTCMG